MTGIDFDNPKLHRTVRAIASRLASAWPGVETDELVEEGYLRLLTTPRRFDPTKGGYWGWARRHAIEGMRMFLRRKRARDMAPIECDFPEHDSPEPTPELVQLFGILTDSEADVMCFGLGMDGTGERGNIAVGSLLGFSSSKVFRLRHSASAKIRERLGA